MNSESNVEEVLHRHYNCPYYSPWVSTVAAGMGTLTEGLKAIHSSVNFGKTTSRPRRVIMKEPETPIASLEVPAVDASVAVEISASNAN
jgi:hypothetical protein